MKRATTAATVGRVVGLEGPISPGGRSPFIAPMVGENERRSTP